jgi:hypothetical protein
MDYQRGQSAIEYLMTYGWMLLVVAIIGGAIFAVVQGSGIQSVSGFTGKEVTIDDFGMNSDDELMLAMRNTAADEIQVKAVELKDPETGATTRVLPEKEIDVGGAKTIKVDGFQTTSSSNKQDLRVIYDSGGLEDQMVEGTITGKLKAKNHVYLQNAAFNRSTNTLNITAQNTGNSEATVDYAVNSDSNSFTGNLGTLSSGETTSFTVNTDETFPLQNVSLNVEGQYFSNSQKQLKCTPTKGLVGYWPFNEEEDSEKSRDLSGYRNDASVDKDVSRVEGIDGYAYRSTGNNFDGSLSGEGALYIEDSQSLTFDGNLTVSMWLKNQDGGGLVDGTVLDKGAHFQNEEGAFTVHTGGSGYPSLFVADGSERVISTANIDVQNEKWQHFAGVYSFGRYAESYSNGDRDIRTLTDLKIQDTNDRMTVGRRTGWHNYAEVSFDELYIFNAALNPEEIERLYNAGESGYGEKGCRLGYGS